MNKHSFTGNISRRFIFRSALAAGFLAALSMGARTARAQAFANFTGGNDTTAGGTATPGPDTYKGTAGNGWAGAYVIAGNNPGFLTATVASANPLSGGGNYLSLSDGAADNSDAALTRAYNGVSATGNQTISFDYRLDTTLSAGYVTLADAVAGTQGTSSNSSFIIRDFAASTGTAVGGKWALYNGVRGNTNNNTSNYIDSGLSVITGDVYHFTINLNPAARTYTVNIADTTASTSYTSGTLNFRTDNFTLQNALAFNDSNGGNALGYSLDGISIVPEPSTWILGLVAIGILGVTFWRRRTA